MSDLIIDDIEDEKVVSVEGAVAVAALEEFRDKLETTGLISKPEILSVEAIIGSGKLMRDGDVGMYIDTPLSIGVDTMIARIDTIKTSIKDVELVNTKVALESVYAGMGSLIYVKRTLTRLFGKDLAELQHLVRTKYQYISNINDTIDPTNDINIIDLLTRNYGYSKNVFAIEDIELLEELLNEEGIEREMIPLKLLSILKTGNIGLRSTHKVTIENITQGDIFNLNYGVMEKLDELISDGRSCINTLTNESYYVEVSDIKHIIMDWNNIKDYYSDRISLHILATYANRTIVEG